jgi:hypothetical protein
MQRSLCLQAVLILVTMSIGHAQEKARLQFVLNPDRAYLYIQFDHFGPGASRSENEPRNRVWLRLVNNCAIPIEVRVNGFPEGHQPLDEVAINDEVIPDRPYLKIERSPMAGSMSVARERTPSPGYESEVSSSHPVLPGQTILFSLPTTQFADDWHIEIPYEFVLPGGKGPRPEEIGGTPVMFISYALWWLPPHVQEQVRAENALAQAP